MILKYLLPMLLLTGCFAAGNTLVSLKYQTIITNTTATIMTQKK
jgi:uncharacterized cupredoxin-like copper-binding protein